MGRWYGCNNGTGFEGKFWFGVQSSTALGKMGFAERSESIVTYDLNDEDIPILHEYMDDVRAESPDMPSDELIIASNYEALYKYSNEADQRGEDLEMLANYEIALKSLMALKECGYISVDCEL